MHRVIRDETAARLALQVSDALDQMLLHCSGCPQDADRFDWSSEVLDELARAVATLGQVVDRLAGGTAAEDDTAAASDSIDGLASELATAIVRQRNTLVAEGASRRRQPGFPTLLRASRAS